MSRKPEDLNHIGTGKAREMSVDELEKENERLLGLLAHVTTAVRDIYMDQPPMAPSGATGVDALLHELVAELRGRGIDDEGGWDCDITQNIPVAGGAAGPRR